MRKIPSSPWRCSITWTLASTTTSISISNVEKHLTLQVATHHTSTPLTLTLTMRFTQQLEVIATVTFALFSLCVYANPMGNHLGVSGQLLNRQNEIGPSFCTGLSEQHCQDLCDTFYGMGLYKHKCEYEPKYVNLNTSSTPRDWKAPKFTEAARVVKNKLSPMSTGSSFVGNCFARYVQIHFPL